LQGPSYSFAEQGVDSRDGLGQDASHFGQSRIPRDADVPESFPEEWERQLHYLAGSKFLFGN
jgi:hypothetical protein